MKIFINDSELEIFIGAQVKNALLKFSKEEYQAVASGEKEITDKFKNPLDLDGELTPNQKLYIIKN